MPSNHDIEISLPVYFNGVYQTVTKINIHDKYPALSIYLSRDIDDLMIYLNQNNTALKRKNYLFNSQLQSLIDNRDLSTTHKTVFNHKTNKFDLITDSSESIINIFGYKIHLDETQSDFISAWKKHNKRCINQI